MPKIPHEQFYLSALKRYGKNDPRSLCWNSTQTQELRFSIIEEALGDLREKTVVDAGCGFGDFYLFLKRRNNLPKRYIGIETLKKFAQIARANTMQTILHRDVLKDPLPQADIFVTSGTLNTLTYFESVLFLRRIFEAAKERVVFNFLSAEKESEIYNYIAQKEMHALLQRMKAEVFFEKTGYLKNDMTIGIKNILQ